MKNMWLVSQKLNGMVNRDYVGGSVLVILPPFWDGQPAYQVSVGGVSVWRADAEGGVVKIPRSVCLRASAREAYYLLRRLCRTARHRAGLPSNRAGWGGSL